MRRLTLLALVLLAGCSATALQVLDQLDTRPAASVEAVRLLDLDLESVTLGFDLAVTNPYTFDLPMAELDFALRTDGHHFVNGTTEVGGSIPAKGSRTIALPIAVNYRGLVDAAEDIRPGQVVPYHASLGLTVDVGETPLRVPVEHRGQLPIPNVPDVRVDQITWDELSLTAVTGTLALRIANTNEFPFSLSALDYQLDLAGRRVAGGEERPALALDPGAAGTLQIPLRFSPQEAGLGLLNALRAGTADYAIGGSLTLETPFGPMELPFGSSGTTD